MKFIWHKIHHVRMNNSLVFKIFTVLCSHQFYLASSYCPKENPPRPLALCLYNHLSEFCVYGLTYSGLFYVQCLCSVAQLCPTLCDPMDYSPPGSAVHGIFQAKILEWVDISFLKDLPDPGIVPVSFMSPALQVNSLPLAPPGKPYIQWILLICRFHISELILLN